MFPRESVRRCAVCKEVTPHSRHLVTALRAVSAAALAGAGLCAWRGGDWLGLALVLGVVGVLALLADRERMPHVRCERCRTKQLVEIRRSKPTLDGRTTIDV